jgi:hypothetical protein
MLLGDTPSLKISDTTLTRVLKGHRWELVVKEAGWNGGKTYIAVLREGAWRFQSHADTHIQGKQEKARNQWESGTSHGNVGNVSLSSINRKPQGHKTYRSRPARGFGTSKSVGTIYYRSPIRRPLSRCDRVRRVVRECWCARRHSESQDGVKRTVLLRGARGLLAMVEGRRLKERENLYTSATAGKLGSQSRVSGRNKPGRHGCTCTQRHDG